MTQEEYAKRLVLLQEEMQVVILNAPFAAANDLQSKILQRVFNTGIATDGRDIGQYNGADSKSKGRYKSKRNAAGRRIDKVDLQFTGSLEESIKTGEGADAGTAILGFNNDKEAKIARYNEERYKKPVFKPSEEEQIEAKAFMVSFVRAGLQKNVKAIMNG